MPARFSRRKLTQHGRQNITESVAQSSISMQKYAGMHDVDITGLVHTFRKTLQVNRCSYCRMRILLNIRVVSIMSYTAKY